MLLSGCLLSPVLAQEWPRFRGPNGTGITRADLPAPWDSNNILWKATLPGGGHSSPVLWGERIFLTCADEQSAQRIVLCLNAADGSVRWQKAYPSQAYRQHADNHYASSTPAVDADHVYVCWTTPQQQLLMAIDHGGKEVWRIDLGRYTSQHGSGTSPIVFEDLIILNNDQENAESFVIAVDRKTGQTRWKTPRRSTHMAASTPCLYEPAGQPAQLILTSRSEGITALDPRTGKVLWQVEDILPLRVIASPAMAGNLIIANCGEGGIGRMFVAVKAPAAGEKPEVAWKLTSQIPYVPSPLVRGDLLFTLTDQGVLACRTAATGKLLWEQRIGGAYYSSPVCDGDKLYCISKKGEVTIVAAKEKYELIGRASLGELCYATPAIARGRMYVRTLTQLFCIGR